MAEPEEHLPLVKCLNPDAPYDRHYNITEKGREVARKVKEVEDE